MFQLEVLRQKFISAGQMKEKAFNKQAATFVKIESLYQSTF